MGRVTEASAQKKGVRLTICIKTSCGFLRILWTNWTIWTQLTLLSPKFPKQIMLGISIWYNCFLKWTEIAWICQANCSSAFGGILGYMAVSEANCQAAESKAFGDCVFTYKNNSMGIVILCSNVADTVKLKISMNSMENDWSKRSETKVPIIHKDCCTEHYDWLYGGILQVLHGEPNTISWKRRLTSVRWTLCSAAHRNDIV